MPRSHVLLTTDCVGGVWDFATLLAGGLVGRGWRVSLLAIGTPSAAQRAQAAAVGAALEVAPLKLEWMQDADHDVLATRRHVAALVERLRPDVVHANQFAAACLDGPTGRGVPVVLTLHSDVLSWRRWTLGAPDEIPAVWQAYVSLVREALARADSVVAVSHFLAEQTRHLYGVERPIRVIHNAWPAPPPLTRAAARPLSAGARRFAGRRFGGTDPAGRDATVPSGGGQLGPPRPLGERPRGSAGEGRGADHEASEGPVTLLAGRVWDAAKNVSLAAEAARGWLPGAVYLAGQTANPDSGGHAQVPPPLEALGYLEREALDDWLARADVYLSPARYDPFGLLPLQAALHGCALLLSDIPSYRELWDGAARFFRPDDADDLRRQWQRLLDQPGEAAQRARQRARICYTPARMAAAYAALYQHQPALVA